MRTIRAFAISALALMLALTATAAGAAAASPSRTDITRTRVVVFQPPIPTHAPSQRGECWTESVADARPGAWRCMIGNAIHDPCFAIEGLRDAVVCGANPVTRQSGFVMHLTKPLPAARATCLSQSPWILELGDGSYCVALTGTRPFADGKTIAWGCSDSSRCAQAACRQTGVFAKLDKGKVWVASKVTYSGPFKPPAGMKVLGVKSVPIATVWR